MSIHYQAHVADPVSGLIGMNSSTGGTTKDGGKWGIIKEAKNVLGGEYTSHNCYGEASKECQPLWQDQGGQATWETVYNPETNKTISKNRERTNK